MEDNYKTSWLNPMNFKKYYGDKHFFFKDIIKNKENMIDYVKSHYLYRVHWHKNYTIANNVKLHSINLQLDEDEKSIAYELCTSDSKWSRIYIENLQVIEDEFKDCFPNYQIFYEGRTNGYLCLYENQKSICFNPKYENFDLLNDDYSLEFYFNLIQCFDVYCDHVRIELIRFSKRINEYNKTIESFIGKLKPEFDNLLPFDFFEDDHLIPITDNNIIIGFYDNSILETIPNTLIKDIININEKILISDENIREIKKISIKELLGVNV